MGPLHPKDLNIDHAVDESDDVDSDFASTQKRLSQKRRAAKDSPEARLQKALPCQFLPNTRPLTVSDLESVVALENAAFPNPEHRASREKLEYRLTTCPELSLGVFCTVVPGQAKGWQIETLASAKPVETHRADGAVSVLLAHIVSTASLNETVTDSDMGFPADWRARGGKSTELGHQESGRTIALHSLAVVPKLQGCGVGKMIVKAYIQQMNNSGLADRVALLCQDVRSLLSCVRLIIDNFPQYLVNYYERFGFQSKGASPAQFGGGGWHDMTLELPGPSKPPF
ncbi:hypothetical protein QBC34DRAFT_62646 [Podospora aff. communis PSN243]|uniref:N-acetyltransferase domain-containing protein n=1 Tax=Podospora aff. communis PSN243 TaxID=3040156 RepID=A0AAV9GQN3_9PEZI|nr:hypothetical protein QBC34DRAFT_62646 [Podospora aff. communis PSN243]